MVKQLEDLAIRPMPLEPSGVPFAVTNPTRIPADRYFSEEFHRLENERLWPRVWQMACRLEQIPNPGDFLEYVITDQSVLLVRQDDGSIKGLYNACRHRGTELAKGCGNLPGGHIVCPFHGWTYHLDGGIASVYAEETFRPECMASGDLALRECKVDVWEGFVFVNLSDSPPPLAEALSPMIQALSPVPLGRMKVRWWKSVVLDANWKQTQEAFMEGWHTPQTHPQLALGMGLTFPADFTRTDGFANGNAILTTVPSAFEMFVKTLEDFTETDVVLAWSKALYEGLDSLVLERDMRILEGLKNKPIPEGKRFGELVLPALYDYAVGAGAQMPEITDEWAALWGSDAFMFPNFLILPYFGNAAVMRSRPLAPQKCRYDLISIAIPTESEDYGVQFPTTDLAPGDESIPLIFRQDFSNIERQQRGVHTRGYEASRMSRDNEEPIISNMHMEVDRYLSRP